MSALVDRITAVQRKHYPVFDENGHINGTVPGKGAWDCWCGEVVNTTFDAVTAHVAERIAEALQLTEVLALRDRHREERWPSGTGSNCAECNGRRFPCPTRQVLDRWVFEWTPAEEQR